MNNTEPEPQRFLGLSHFDWAIVIPFFLIVAGIFGSVPIQVVAERYALNSNGHVVVASAHAEPAPE